ncbi:MAG: hypothetical protein GY846_21665, partial [Deltaproteobacteria bacterium]|nr:hypothetical protein [Deltaproteobacteria bacterium]
TEKAISEDQTGMYVYVVGKDNKVEKRSVKVGFLYKNQKIIWKGLKAGDLVITEGLQMVKPGMVAQPREAKPGSGEKTRNPDPHSTGKP